MEKAKFLKFNMILAICLLSLFTIGEYYLTPSALAGNPNKPTPKYGYAKLTDSDYIFNGQPVSPKIVSDNNGQYIDSHNTGGEDRVEITTSATDVYILTFLGTVENESTRKAKFLFDLFNGSQQGVGSAVYDILNRDMYGKIHVAVTIYEDDSGVVQFVVDPGWDGTSDDAVTQRTVDAFNGNDKNVRYWTNRLGHIIYYLYYDDNFDVQGNTSSGWLITAKSGTKGVRLCAKTSVRGRLADVPLATYGYLPFQINISINNPESSSAPMKHSTLSSIWGKIKTEK